MKYNLILLTAALRFDNLYSIAKSIKDARDNNPDINFIWIICKDNHRGYGNLEITKKYCEINNIIHYVIDSGKPDSEIDRSVPRPGNFGGDMYNKPLQEVVEKYDYSYDPDFNIKDSWVYILDDDNLVHPLLPIYFKKAVEVSNGRRIIWLTKIRSTGLVDEVDRLYGNTRIPMDDDTGQWIIPMQFCPDPSQMILHYSIIKENGYYNPKSDYDYTWFVPLIDNYKHEVIWHHETDHWNSNIVHAYWNGFRYKDQFEKDRELLNSDSITTAQHFYVESEDHTIEPHIYPVSKKLGRIIMEMIRQEMIENKVIKNE